MTFDVVYGRRLSQHRHCDFGAWHSVYGIIIHVALAEPRALYLQVCDVLLDWHRTGTSQNGPDQLRENGGAVRLSTVQHLIFSVPEFARRVASPVRPPGRPLLRDSHVALFFF